MGNVTLSPLVFLQQRLYFTPLPQGQRALLLVDRPTIMGLLFVFLGAAGGW